VGALGVGNGHEDPTDEGSAARGDVATRRRASCKLRIERIGSLGERR
jgi:hypothetical protein